MRLKAKALSALDRSPRSEHQVAFTRDASSTSDATRTPSHRRRAFPLVLATTALALLALAPSADAAPERTPALTIGAGDFNGFNPQSLAVHEATGDVYAMNVGQIVVRRYDANGAPKNFTAGPDAGTNTLTDFAGFDSPGASQVAIDNSGGASDGNIYITDAFAPTVRIFAPSGAPLGTLTGSGTPSGGFGESCGVTIDQANGDVYVGDFANNRLWRYSPSGAVPVEGDYSGGINPANNPCQVGVANGRVFARGYNDQVVKSFPTSAFALGAPPSPTGVQIGGPVNAFAVDQVSGDLYMNDGTKVEVLRPNGDTYYSFGTEEGIVNSYGVAVASGGGAAFISDVTEAFHGQIEAYGALPTPNRSHKDTIGAGDFNGFNPQSLAVHEATGDVYAMNVGQIVVRRYDANGAPKNFTAGPDAGTNTLTDFAGFDSPGASQVAIDNSGGASDGNIYITDAFAPTVRIFAPSGAPLGTLTGSGTPSGGFGESCGVTIDQANGDVYVGDFANNRLWRYSPSGAVPVEGDYSGGINPANNPCQVGVANGRVFARGYNDQVVKSFPTSAFALGAPPSPTGVQIGGPVNAFAVDQVSGDLYMNDGTKVEVLRPNGDTYYSFGTEEGIVNSYGVAVASGGGAAFISDVTEAFHGQIEAYGPEIFGHQLAVEKVGNGTGVITSDPAGINCGPTCVSLFDGGAEVTLSAVAEPGSRFEGWSGCDSVTGDECHVTLDVDVEVTARFHAKPAITETSAKTLSPTSADLKGKLNPNGEATSYHFEYGTVGPCDANACVSTPVQVAGSGSGVVAVAKTISGLAPSSLYHYRLVASNEIGATESADATFTTYPGPPEFGPCPNDEFRTGTAARLPNCRAYEQVTPIEKNGNDITGRPDFVQAATEGDGITFVAASGIPGGVGATDFTTYVATRDDDEWTTGGLIPPPSYGTGVSIEGWTPDLSQTFSVASNVNAPDHFLSRSREGELTTIFSTQDGDPNFAGASADGSKVFFEFDKQLTPDAAGGAVNLYVWDRDQNTIALAGVLPDDACADPPCTPSAGSFAGPYNWFPVLTGISPDEGGATGTYYTYANNAISNDGDAYFTAAHTGQLYRRSNAGSPDAETQHVSASHRTIGNGPGGRDILGPLPAEFQTATPDGEHVIFTSREKLTDDATTGPEPAVAPPPAAIERSDLDGNGIEHQFVPADASSIAVDAGYIYWTDPASGSIGRANLDGSAPNPSFISGVGAPIDVAVDGSHVYWANPGGNAIGRANIDGTAKNLTFITGASNPQGVALDATHVWWTNFDGASVGRANLDGTDVDQNVITFEGHQPPRRIAVDASHVYLTHRGDYITRQNFDGSGQLIQGFSTLANTADIAVDGAHVYFAQPGSEGFEENEGIGRADLDLTNMQCCGNHFIDDVDKPQGVAVDGGHVYWTTSPPSSTNPGRDLYRFDAGSDELTDLAPLSDPAQPNGADVRGVLGADDSGDYVYFAANGDFDGSGPAIAGNCQGNGLGQGQCNLYLAHDDEVTFIAPMDTTSKLNKGVVDSYNWVPSSRAGNDQQRFSRVSADGNTLLFQSQNSLTGYANNGWQQVYRYTADDQRLVCVSCNPTGAPATYTAALQNISTPGPSFPENDGYLMTRNLSPDGNRIFFASEERLLPGDSNSVFDVYEWEAEDSGSCEVANVEGGCLYLISSGTGSSASGFGDASVDGDQAFIFTRDRLVPQDGDDLRDIYAVSIGGGIEAQHEVPEPPCGDDCQGDPGPAPAATTPGSSANSGPGNQGRDRTPATGSAGKKAQKKCAKKKGKKKKRCRARARRANSDLGGNR